MISLDKKQLILMHPVRIDKNLSKYSNLDEDRLDSIISTNFNELYSSPMNSGEFLGERNNPYIWDGIPFQTKKYFREKWKVNLYNLYVQSRILIYNLFKENVLTDEEFFDSLKKTTKELQTLNEEEKNLLLKNIQNLYKTKRVLLANQLLFKNNLDNAEKTLKENGFNKYCTEEDIVKFVLKSDVGISLIEMEYFKYEIPEDVLEKMIKADSLKVFDNFYILYKEKNIDLKKLREENKAEVKKDPILFGVINGSSKLYYIADWITDYCDLTLEYLVKNGVKSNNL